MKSKILRRITAVTLVAVSIFTIFSSTVPASAAESETQAVSASYKGTTGASSCGVKWKSTVKYTFTSAKDNKKHTVIHNSGSNFSVHYFAKNGQSLNYVDKSQWAFCLQPEADVSMMESGTYGSNDSVAAWKNLKSWQKYSISYLYTAMYSLSKSTYNKTYTDDFTRYWCAAQLIEHEVVAGFRNSDFSNNGSSPFVSGGKVVIGGSGSCSQSNITSAYNNLVSTLKDAVAGIDGNYPTNTGSSESNAPTFTLKQTGANTYTYQDSSAHTSYKYYDILIPDAYKSCVKVSVKDNKLSITSTKAINTVVLTFRNKKAYSLLEYKNNNNISDINVMMPTSSNNQAVATGSTVFVPKRYIKLTTSDQGIMKLYKTSSNPEMTDNNDCYSLAGAKYQFFMDKNCTKPATNSSDNYMYITTDVNGEGYYGGDTVNVTASLITSYYLKEIEPSKGYKLCNEVHQFKKSSETNKNGIPIYTITCEEPIDNDPIGVLLQKENSNGESDNIPSLEGAEFTVKFYGGMYYTKQELANVKPLKTWVFKTDNNGLVRYSLDYLVSGDDFYDFNGKTSLPKGTVSIQETKAPSNDKYLINDEVFIRHILDENDDRGSVITWNTIKVSEEEKPPEKGYVKIHKTDGAGTNIGGATYGVYSSDVTNSNGMIPSKYLVHPTDGKIITKDDGTASCSVPLSISDDDGNPITYYIQEISVPSSGGWALDKTIYPFNLSTKNSTVDTSLSIEVTEMPVKCLINKVDENNNPVEGATLQIRKISDNSIVQVNGRNTFSSGKSPVSIPNLIEGVRYRLTEIDPPEGYWKADDVEFTAKAGINTVKMVDRKTKVKFAKVDENGNYVSGALLQIREKTGVSGQVRILHQWTSGQGLKTIEGLTAGKEYDLFEYFAPMGKILADNSIKFTVREDGQIETITMKNYPTKVSVQKVDDEGNAVIGAKLRIDDMNGKTVVKEWTTDDKAKNITGILADDTDYQLVETYNPKGYVMSKPVVFHTQEFEDDDIVSVVMTDPKTKVVINKVDDVNNKPLVGATLHIDDAQTLTTVIEPWVSDGKAKEITGVLEAGKTYLLCEDEAPAGYGIAKPVEFIVPENAETVNVTMQDHPTRLLIRKVGDNDNYVSGAILQIIEKNTGNIIDTFRSETTPKNIIGKVKVDTTYILHEVAAPTGKAKAKDVEFIISAEEAFDTYTVTMIDPETCVLINKVDDMGKYISGAKLQIWDENNNIIDTWDSETEPKIITGILKGGKTYTLKELSPPPGYLLSDDVTFTVPEYGGYIEVTMTDQPTELIVNKVDQNGNNVVGAKLCVEDSKGNVVIPEWTTTGNDKELTDYVFKGVLSTTDTYYLVENETPFGYKSAERVRIRLGVTGKKTVTMVDEKINGIVNLYKEDGNGNSLKGAEFELYDAKNNKISLTKNANGDYSKTDTVTVTTLDTDDNGLLKVDGLLPGDYYFVETKSPNGHMPYTNKISFSINADNNYTATITVKDNASISYDTGGNRGAIQLIGCIITVISISIIVLFIKKKKGAKKNEKN